MASTSNPVEEAPPPWLDLPRELTAAILRKLGAKAMLTTAQNVCTAWRSVCQDPAMWRCIHIGYDGDPPEGPLVLDKICRQAVDRSQGQLIDINIECVGDNDLLLYISQSSPQLKRLRIVRMFDLNSKGMTEAVKNLPMLEELHIFYNLINVEAIEAIGRSCPNLKSFKFNTSWYTDQRDIDCEDLEAFAIAAHMPQLRYLQLFGNKMTNKGVQAILDGCPDLESLDLRQCFNVHLSGNLGQLYSRRIADLRFPHDCTDDYDYPYIAKPFEFETYDDDDDDIMEFSDEDMRSDYEDYLEFSGGSMSSYGSEELAFVD